jgi:hypothetical protein
MVASLRTVGDFQDDKIHLPYAREKSYLPLRALSKE